MSPALPVWSALRPVDGALRRLWFEASGEPEARALCLALGAGFEGPAQAPSGPEIDPVAYDEKTARRLLGNISESTLYREIVVGNLTRVPGIRKILVTADSISRWPKRRA